MVHTQGGHAGKSKEMSKIRVDFAGMSPALPPSVRPVSRGAVVCVCVCVCVCIGVGGFSLLCVFM